MRIRNRKILCFLLAMLVLLFGTRCEKSRLETLFACAPAENADSLIRVADAAISDTQLCTTEMLGVRSHTGIRQLSSRFVSIRGEARLSLFCLCSAILSLDEGKFFTNSALLQSEHPRQEELVPRYIHRSDGKKRI